MHPKIEEINPPKEKRNRSVPVQQRMSKQSDGHLLQSRIKDLNIGMAYQTVGQGVTNQPAVARAEHSGRINDRSRTNNTRKEQNQSEQGSRDPLVVMMVKR